MLLDTQNLFSDNQAITTGTIYSTNVIRFGEGDVSNVPIIIQVVDAFEKLTSLTVKIQTSATPDFTESADLVESKLLLADLVEGARFPISYLPTGNKGYMRIAYVAAGEAAETNGKITAGVVAASELP